MSEFAKLFGSGDDQIVVLLQGNDDDSAPEVRIFYQPPDLGVCSVALGYEDTDEGWEHAEEAFRRASEETIRSMIKETLDRIGLSTITSKP